MKSLVKGLGEPVLILHEWLGDHRNWLPMLEYLDQKAYSFHFIDLPGYGLAKGELAIPSAISLAEKVVAYANANSLKRFTIVGHSMSSLIAHSIGMIAPDRLNGLTMICPVPPSGFQTTADGVKNLHAIAHDRLMLRKAILDRGGKLETERWVNNKTELAWSASSPETKIAYLDMFLSPTTFIAEGNNLSSANIIVGEADIPFYQKDSVKSEFEIFYTKLTITSLSKCGHYPMLQQPAKTAKALQFLLSKDRNIKLKN